MLFYNLVDNSILNKKDTQHFCIGQILFSENKIIRSVVGGKVDGQIVFGARSEKRKNLFDAKWQLRKNLFGSQRVKKAGVDQSDVKNYCSISDLTFMSKIIEKLTCY